ncbi:hypothetical protein [Chamaesiphon minutus]|uniref:Uncharacterized protein n=1 Tax=Chamaesiphon minutus (strain ATCC 27169 / PCC 6605) TaxID=1173020 RepID=K9UBU2_CHAP6|nr:hypothetical protein [Chamaesiphon minutus]AFY91689.1 hypothetical protein Cha6605_0392 [Chamaesiphon minutus PCC 6605]
MSTLPSKLLFASLISSATLFGTFAIGSVAQADVVSNCTIPASVSCNISSSKGIKSVKIQTQGSSGPVYIVNKSYPNCPNSVTVGWDSAYQVSDKEIVECSGVSGGGSGGGSGSGSGSDSGKPGRLKG